MQKHRDRTRPVLEPRYLRDMTLEQVGQIMGVIRERVRQIEAKAIRIIRAYPTLRQKALNAFAGVNVIK